MTKEADDIARAKVRVDHTLPPTVGVIYEERGYRIIGDVSNAKQLKKIQAESKKYVTKYKKIRDKAWKVELRYLEALWLIDHPVQAGWQRLKKWFKQRREAT